MIRLNQLKKEFDGRVIFNKINLEIKEGIRLGIIGNNGTGKTTLVRLIMEEIFPEAGRVDVSDYEHISYMPQVKLENNESTLSGGERTKKEVLRTFNEYSNTVILDEPTNHLDYKGIHWLKGLIDGYYGTVIIISHDRYFMDLVCEEIYELANGSGKLFKGNYSDYKMQKEHLFKTQLAAFEEQEKTKQQIQEDVNQLKGWSSKGHNQSRKKARASGNKLGGKEFLRVKAKKKDKAVKSKIKRLEKIDLEGVTKPIDPLEVKFHFHDNSKKIKRLISVEDISMGFDEKTLFSSEHFWIERGERLGLIGLNGTGKTTFIKMVLGDYKTHSGRLYINPSMRLGLLSQDVLDLEEDKTVLQSFDYSNKDKITLLRIQLNNLGIDKSYMHKKIGTLSMGERTRVKLTKLLLEEYDVLILDEPTNHLDIISKETLAKALGSYDGTLIVVSHDYYFLDQTCNSSLVIENRKLKKVNQSPVEVINTRENG